MSRIVHKKKFKQVLWEVFCLLAGATLVAFATQYIFDPAGLVTGGVSGLSIVIKYLTGKHMGYQIPLWQSSLILNIPIFLLAVKTDGLRNVLKTGFVLLIITVELFLFPSGEWQHDNLLLVAIYGGICFGVGTGLLISVQATSGGTDMLGYSLHHFFRHISIGRLIQVIDGAVVILGAIVFNLEHTLYAIFSVYVMGKVTDYVINSGKSAKMALIISEKNELIASDILEQLDRGVTGLKGKGMYTGDERVILICICSTRDIVSIKDIVREYDKRAFFVVADVAEAMGEGFLEDWTAKG